MAIERTGCNGDDAVEGGSDNDRLFSGQGSDTLSGIGRITTVTLVISGFLLAACGGGGGGKQPSPGTPLLPPDRQSPPPSATADPTYHLGTARFTTDQPVVLEQIGAHHAYARGLTGRGVRIGIEDSIVDYTQSAEFGSRVRLRDMDGAKLSFSIRSGMSRSAMSGVAAQAAHAAFGEATARATRKRTTGGYSKLSVKTAGPRATTALSFLMSITAGTAPSANGSGGTNSRHRMAKGSTEPSWLPSPRAPTSVSPRKPPSFRLRRT